MCIKDEGFFMIQSLFNSKDNTQKRFWFFYIKIPILVFGNKIIIKTKTQFHGTFQDEIKLDSLLHEKRQY